MSTYPCSLQVAHICRRKTKRHTKVFIPNSTHKCEQIKSGHADTHRSFCNAIFDQYYTQKIQENQDYRHNLFIRRLSSTPRVGHSSRIVHLLCLRHRKYFRWLPAPTLVAKATPSVDGLLAQAHACKDVYSTEDASSPVVSQAATTTGLSFWSASAPPSYLKSHGTFGNCDAFYNRRNRSLRNGCHSLRH